MARLLASGCRLLSEEVPSGSKAIRGSTSSGLGVPLTGPSSASRTIPSTPSSSSSSFSPSSLSSSALPSTSSIPSTLNSWSMSCFSIVRPPSRRVSTNLLAAARQSPLPHPSSSSSSSFSQHGRLLAAEEPLLCSAGRPSPAFTSGHASGAASAPAESREVMTRIGSWPGNGLAILRSYGRSYREATKARPYSMGFVVCFLKGVAASLLAQTAIEHKEKVDRSRVWALALFSGLFTGCGYHYIFNIAFVRCFGPMAGVRTLLPRMLADAAVVFPLMYMPTFLLIDETVRFGSPAQAFPRWQSDIQSSMVEYVKIWPLANVLSFTVVPAELRVSFMATVSFAWLVMLSIFSQ